MPSIDSKHTPGPWYWHTDHVGNVSLRTPDRGNLIVMDFARKGMQGAAPRLAYWKGLPGGLPRERMGGILDDFSADHPDAVLIASAPDLKARNAELVQALELAQKLMPVASARFPKSIRNSDTFQLNIVRATIGTALHNAKQGSTP